MKVLMLNYEYPPIGGGGGVISKNIAEGLVALGNEVHVLTSNFNELPEASVPITGLKVTRLKVKRAKNHQSNPVEMLDWIVRTKIFCKTYLQHHSFDICFTNFVMPGGEVALFLKEKFNLNFVVISHGHDIPWVHSKRLWPLYLLAYTKIKKVLNKADLIFVQTPEMLHNLLKFNPSSEQKAAIIPNGFSKNIINQKSTNKTFTLVFAGRLVNQKRPDILIKSFISFLDSGAEGELLIYGDGPLRKQLQIIIDGSGYKMKIKILGKVEHSEVIDALHSSDLYVTTSLNEGMSMSMIEAAAVGLPIITTPVSGAHQLVNEHNGIVVPFKDTENTAKAIQSIYSKWLNGKNLVDQNKLVEVRKQYNWDVICAQYNNELKQLVK
jgi:glycosyltransferase involved in cell wall biosynthesis